MAPHCPSEKTPNSLAQHSRHFRICPLRYPLTSSIHPGLQVYQMPDSFPNGCSPLFHTLARVLSATRTLYGPRWTVSLPLGLQNPVRMTSPLSVFNLSKEYESLFPLGSIPPPEHTAHAVFSDILSSSLAGTMCLLVTAESPVVNQHLTHRRCSKLLLHE